MTDWTPLAEELARWRADGLSLSLWWRDDDAVQVTPDLERLSALSQSLGLPVHLAVIPEPATQGLGDYVATRDHLVPVVHGWSHENHAPQGHKKAEFGDHRPLAEMTDQIRAAGKRLASLFGDRLAPMFVPPWNRTCDEVIAALPEAGFRMISTFQPREAVHPAPGLERTNTHLDPINWRGDRSLVPPQDLIAQIARDLADRRTGRADNSEPYGLLTHHLVHDEAIWEFAADLAARLLDGPGQPWRADRTKRQKE